MEHDDMTGFDSTVFDRDEAAANGDLALTLELDDVLESEWCMHSDGRLTCFSCQSWADHAHDQVTGARVLVVW